MKFAYLILAHQYPFQLKELIDQLQDGHTYFFVHIDKKTDLETFQKQSFSHPEKVVFCQNRIPVNWGGFSQIRAVLQLIREFINKNVYCDYIHLLSGQDFPIKTNRYIKEFFEKDPRLNYLSYFPLPYKDWNYGGFERILYRWRIDEIGLEQAKMEVERQKREGQTVPFPEGFRPYGGSQWWSLHYDCVHYLAEICTPEHPLYSFFMTTQIPDELFFQTLLLHLEFKHSIVNTHLRYMEWEKGSSNPKCLRREDLEKLLQSSHLFARKFNDYVDYRVKQELREILSKL